MALPSNEHAGGDDDDVLADLAAPAPATRFDVIEAALGLVTTLAAATIGNAHGASVTLDRNGRATTVAASNDAVLRMDGHQYDTGQGPCLSAKADGRAYYIASLDDEQRWPAFTPLALQQGIHSILSSPLLAAAQPLGALNIYSRQLHAFDERDQELALLFADQASDVLTRAHANVTDEQHQVRWNEALAARHTIALAQGVLMRSRHITATAAKRLIHSSARAENMTVVQYATRLVLPYADDEPDRSVP